VSANGANERQRGIPFPGTFIVDRGGRVKARFFEDSYTVRNTVSNIRVRLSMKLIPPSPARASPRNSSTSSRIHRTTESHRATVFSIVARITPHPGVHVYAPGAANYKTIELKVLPGQYIKSSETIYPPSEIYFFKR
jgi:hypothetical protein